MYFPAGRPFQRSLNDFYFIWMREWINLSTTSILTGNNESSSIGIVVRRRRMVVGL